MADGVPFCDASLAKEARVSLFLLLGNDIFATEIASPGTSVSALNFPSSDFPSSDFPPFHGATFVPASSARNGLLRNDGIV